MPSNNVCWGIEIGSNAIKAVKLENDGGEIRVVDVAVIPHKKVLSTPDLNQEDATRLALGTFASQYDLSGASVAISVPGHTGFARFAKLPPVEPKKIPDIVKFEAVQQIPFPIEDVEWDYQTFQAPDSPDVEVGIFAITREKILQRLQMYQDLHIVPSLVTLSPVAVYNAIAFDLAFDENTPGTILLDIGTTSSDLIVAEAGRVWIRTFPIGGHHFTEALVESFKLSYSKAEKLKKETENPKHARQLLQAMRPVFQDLAQDVQRSIGYYQSLHRDADIKRLIGVGSTFRIPGLRKFLKQQLQLDVYRLEQFKRLTISGPLTSEFQTHTLNLATAYGLALQGLKGESGHSMAALEANLMPVPVLRSAMWHQKTKWFAAAAGLAIVGGAALFIRPFLDSQAVAGAPRPDIIPEVIQVGQKLKSEAQQAGVTTAPAADYTAANVIELLESRGVYAHLVNDLGMMFYESQQTVPNWRSDQGESRPNDPAFIMQEFRTDYEPPSAAASTSGSSSSRGRSRQQETTATGGVDLDAGLPKIRITLVATTTQPDPQKFMLATIDQWLRENRERAGVPYRIRLEAPDGGVIWNVNIAEAGLAQADGRRNTRSGGADPLRGPRSRTPESRFNYDPNESGDSNIIGLTPEERAGIDPLLARSQGNQPGRPFSGNRSGNLNQIAPIEVPPAESVASQTATFTLNWTAVVLPPTDGDDGGES